jgi:archaellin
MKIDFINDLLVEARTGAQPHPEDSIFDGAQAAKQAVQSLLSVIKKPGSVTIKFDGFPALIFGRTRDGKLSVMDKYMFDAKVFAKSPQDWQKYDSQKASGKTRPDLYAKLANIWSGLDAAVGNSPGFFWGDLLWYQQLQPVKGMYVFKPNVVEYRVPADSDLGKQIGRSVGGVVVHQYFADDSSTPQQWNGQGLERKGAVVILSPDAGVKFKLNDPVQLTKGATAAVNQYSNLAEKFLAGMEGVAQQAIQKYTNKKVTGQTNEELVDWLQANVSGKQYKFLVGENYSGYLHRNQKGLNALFMVWNAIYVLKENLTQQLEVQVQGIEQWVGGHKQGEGFVFNTPQGLVKLVNRGTFSAALFSK